MVQECVAFIAQQIQVQTGRILGIPVKERAVYTDGMMVEPAVLCIQMKSIKGSLRRGILHHRVIRLEEAGIADTKWDLPATVVVVWRCNRNGSPIKPAENQSGRLSCFVAPKCEFNLKQRAGVPAEFYVPDSGTK